jgi:hypothetical protein
MATLDDKALHGSSAPSRSRSCCTLARHDIDMHIRHQLLVIKELYQHIPL